MPRLFLTNRSQDLALKHAQAFSNQPFAEPSIKTCPEPESNQRHEDFQSSALPTELTGQELREQDLNL